MKCSLGPESAREAPAPVPALTTEQPTPIVEMSDEAKVNQIYNWILTGASDFDVIEATQQAWPGAKIGTLLKRAVRKMQEAASIDAETVIGFSFAATRDMYRRMVEIGDFPGALRAIKQLTELTARYGSFCKREPPDATNQNAKPTS